MRHGKALVDAAKAAGVKHFVWSTLDHTNDPYVPHWNSKAKVDDYLKESGVPRTSYVYSPCVTESLLNEDLCNKLIHCLLFRELLQRPLPYHGHGRWQTASRLAPFTE